MDYATNVLVITNVMLIVLRVFGYYKRNLKLHKGIKLMNGSKDPATTGIQKGIYEFDASIFAYDTLLERLMGDVDFAKKVMEIFITDSKKQYDNLVVAIQENKSDLVERLAHTIKGSASNMGLEQVRSVAFKIEDAGRNGDISLASTYMPELESTLHEAILALQMRLV